MGSDPAPTRRLLHVFATFDAGGPQVRTAELLPHWPAAWRHRVLAADGRIGAASRLPEGVEVHPMRTRRAAGAIAAFVRELRAFRPDLVLTYNWGASFGCLAALLCGLDFVHHEEVVAPEEHEGAGPRRDWFRRLVLRHARAVVVPSSGLFEKALMRWRLPTRRVVLVPNGVDLQRHARRLPVAPAPLVVGCIGHFRREKNVARLLRAFAAAAGSLPTCELHLLGDGPERSACEELARDLGVASRVRFLGARDDVAPHLDAMHVFALASDDEQMPLAVLEAMAHGLPVVATAVGDVEAMLPPEQRRFLVRATPGAEAEFARNITTLLKDRDLRARLGAANRRRAVERFGLERTAAAYRSIYERALSAPVRNPPLVTS